MAKFRRLTEVMQINGVRVYLHWSVILIGAVILLGAVGRPRPVLALWGSYFGVLLLHECGHLIAAQWRRSHVWSIELYPIFGVTRFDVPRSRYDHAVIAWGGVVAQCVVALPLVAFVSAFGYTRFDSVNIVLGMFGYYSLFVAAFNLIPARPLDGATAWRLIPALFDRMRAPRKKGVIEWRP